MFKLATIAAASLIVAGCDLIQDENRDPGTMVSRTYPVGAFDKIVVAGPFDVIVTTGGKPGVSAKGGDKLLDQTQIMVEGDTLKIVPKKKDGISFNWGSQGKATFNISTAALNGVTFAGKGTVTIDKVSGDFEGELAGKGSLKIGAVNGGKIKLSTAGSGTIAVAGKAMSSEIDIAGSGDVDAAGLATTDTDISIAGRGTVRANATGTAKIDIVGSGDVTVTGGAKCAVDKTGGGTVTCG